jgi:hypothetical protein
LCQQQTYRRPASLSSETIGHRLKLQHLSVAMAVALRTGGIGATRIAVMPASTKKRTILQRIPIGFPPSTTTVCPVTLSARQ